MSNVFYAETDLEIRDCFPVLLELRPHLVEAEFAARILRQQAAGYRLIFRRENDVVKAVAGFRISECLAWGRFLYVDDLIVPERYRKQGHARVILEWLAEFARRGGLQEFHLDSGVQRFDAHRLYLNFKMCITCHHFAMPVG